VYQPSGNTNTHNVIVYFRDSTLSHIHTTLLSNSLYVDLVNNQTINGDKIFNGNVFITNTDPTILTNNISNNGALVVSGGTSIGGNLLLINNAFLNGNVVITNTTPTIFGNIYGNVSTVGNNLNGALVVVGGASFGGNVLYNGNVVITNTSPAFFGNIANIAGNLNGALVVAGGTSIGGNLAVSGNILIGSNTPTVSGFIAGSIVTMGGVYAVGNVFTGGNILSGRNLILPAVNGVLAGTIINATATQVSFPNGITAAGAIVSSVASAFTNTFQATTITATTGLVSNTTLAVTTTSTLTGAVSMNSTIGTIVGPSGSVTGALIVAGGTAVKGNLSVYGNIFVNQIAAGISGNIVLTSGKISLIGNSLISGNLVIGGNIASTGNTNGSLVVLGGTAITGNVYIKGNLYVEGCSYVYGNLLVSASTSSSIYYTTSDYRIKRDVVDLSVNYTVDDLRSVYYYNNVLNKNCIGFIAYEVQQQFPFLVTGIKDGTEIQSVNYEGLIGILVNEVQMLKKRVSELEKNQRERKL
jgi:cytoskeletal protein CcmA (bactofilin family)